MRGHSLEQVLVAGRVGEFVLGDLAREEVDAIVNPSNGGFLLSFTGVNGALLEAGGEALADECRGLGIAAEGEVRSTGPGYSPSTATTSGCEEVQSRSLCSVSVCCAWLLSEPTNPTSTSFSLIVVTSTFWSKLRNRTRLGSCVVSRA